LLEIGVLELETGVDGDCFGPIFGLVEGGGDREGEEERESEEGMRGGSSHGRQREMKNKIT